jgi:hypothetical protein
MFSPNELTIFMFGLSIGVMLTLMVMCISSIPDVDEED